MYRIHKFAKRAGEIGKPLPDLYNQFLPPNYVKFRHGGVSMIAGPPGSMKSLFTLNMVARWTVRDGLRILYFCGDSDEFTVVKRMSSILSGVNYFQVEADLVAGNTAPYEEALKIVKKVGWVFDDLRIADIKWHTDAFETVYGDFPDAIVVDNVINYIDNATSWEQAGDLVAQLNVIARQTASAVLALHHTSEDSQYPREKPPPLQAVQGKCNQLPRLTLTTGSADTMFYAACVKNTNGPQDRTGKSVMSFTMSEALRLDEPEWTRR